jgi:hypothetical protein
LDAAILSSLPELATAGAHLEWVSPLEGERFVEYQDGAFLSALGLLDLSGMLAEFWPQGGPRWDALACVILPNSDRTGVLLVEAKSYPQEMYSNGCCASEASRTKILKALQRTRQWLSVDSADWTGPLYQFANRLAHLYFLRELAGVPTWFVNICFAGDPHRPTPPPVWQEALQLAKASIGLIRGPIPFCADIILEAASRELFQTEPTRPARVASAAVATANKEWRFLHSERLGDDQFLAFANVRGSSSLRLFDADSGALMGEPRYGRRRTYQEAFSREMAASEPVCGPSAVSFTAIPAEHLRAMREQAGLNEVIRETPVFLCKPGILTGVDELVDRTLGITSIGQTSPHYRHRSSHRTVATGPRIDGCRLLADMYSRIVANGRVQVAVAVKTGVGKRRPSSAT